MDWTYFDKSFEKLRIALRDFSPKTAYSLEIQGNYRHYRTDIEIIIQRIETEVQEFMELQRKIRNRLRNGEKPNKKSLNKAFNTHGLLRVDIKSFFIFTRMFLDTLAKIIRLSFGKLGDQLARSMSALLKKKKLLELDSNFAEGLRKRMLWFEDFKKKRDEIEHYLGRIRTASTREGGFGFTIEKGLISLDDVEPINDYMKEVLAEISGAIIYIYKNRF